MGGEVLRAGQQPDLQHGGVGYHQQQAQHQLHRGELLDAPHQTLLVDQRPFRLRNA